MGPVSRVAWIFSLISETIYDLCKEKGKAEHINGVGQS